MLIRRIFYESFENLPCEATSRVSKTFSRRQIKNPFLAKVAQCSGDEKRYIQHDHVTNIHFQNHKNLKKSKTSSLSALLE